MRSLMCGSLILCLLVLPAPAAALADSASLVGHVRDPKGANLRDAVVTLYTRDGRVRVTATTDDEGAYRFVDLAPGEYLVEAQAAGFAPSAAEAVRVGEGNGATLDVGLELAGIREQVVVTASGTAQNADEVSKAVTIVDGQQIEDRDEYSISEALRTVPGLRVQQSGGPGALTTIKTRGLRTEDTAVLVDGFRFRDAAAPQADASGFLEDLVVTDVDRLEVLRGSGSSLYGTNAIGGVVNVVSGAGGGRTRGGVLVEGGSLGFFRGLARIAGGFDEDRIVYSLGATHLNVSDGVDGDDATRNTSVQGRVLFRVSSDATLSGRIYAADSFLQLNESPQAIGALPASGIVDAVALSEGELRRYESGVPVSELAAAGATFVPSANDPDNSREGRFLTGAVTFAHRPAERFGYTVTYHGLRTDRSNFEGPGGVSFEPAGSVRSDYDGRIHTLGARADFRVGPYNFLDAGYELERERFVNRSFQVDSSIGSDVDVTQRSHAFFVQDQVRLLEDRLQISAALRAQFFSLDEPIFTPTSSAPYAGLEFEAPPDAYTGDGSIAYLFRSTGTKIRAHAGNGYRAPSLYERFGTYFDSFFGYSTYGDPRLRPDRSIAVDAGIDQSLFDNRARASATYFYTRLQEIIVFDFSGAIDPATDPFGRFAGYLNTRGGLARGVELSFDAAPTSRTDIAVAYTYTNADQRAPLVGDIIRSFGIPDHQFSLVATQRFGRAFQVTFDLAASSDYLAPIYDPATFASRAYRFEGIVKADVVAGYTLALSDTKRLRFFGKVENLFDREYYENGFGTPGVAGVGGVELRF
jgi:vitamin B12 transporter